MTMDFSDLGGLRGGMGSGFSMLGSSELRVAKDREEVQVSLLNCLSRGLMHLSLLTLLLLELLNPMVLLVCLMKIGDVLTVLWCSGIEPSCLVIAAARSLRVSGVWGRLSSPLKMQKKSDPPVTLMMVMSSSGMIYRRNGQERTGMEERGHSTIQHVASI